MKGARDRKPAGGSGRAHAGRIPDQDTQKISASQLAEVLARVDGDVGESKPSEPRRTISGSRPIIRPRSSTPVDAVPRVSGSPIGIDIPEGQLAIIERPVAEGNVVNATSAHGSDSPEDIAPADPASSIAFDLPAANPPPVEASAADAETAAALVASRRSGRRIAIALVVLAALVALILAYLR